ncbi:MAG TPA: phosphatase PAP2 family protein [Gemmataceae bacterium]|nr:phosphatase PAP2 family protein [Gemmataceae bacterium]
MRANWVAWAIGAGGLAVFAALAWQVTLSDSAVWRFDEEMAHSAKGHAENHPEVLDFARSATDAGGVPAMTSFAVFGALLLLICGHPRLAGIWVLTAAMGCVLNVSGKAFVDRARPGEHLRDEAVTERNASYPSGHSMGSTIGYGTLVYVGFVLLRKRWAKMGLAAAMVLLVGTICWSRVYLRAHWCSDVMGGAAIGIAWLAVCLSLASRAPFPDQQP